MGGKLAGYIFTVVIPVVVAAMLPHIGPEIGFPVILVSLVIGLSDFAWMYSKTHHRTPNMFVIGGMALGALIFGGFAIAFFLLPKKQEPATTKIEPPIQDVSILADCSDTILPLYVPADGRIMEAFVVFDDDKNLVKLQATSYQGKPGEPLNWTAAHQPFTGWKCDLTGQPTIFDVVMTLNVMIRESIRTPNPPGSLPSQISSTSGMPIGQIKEVISQHRIDSNPSTFYLINQSSYFVNIEIHWTASGSIINKFGSQERRDNIPVNAVRYASMGPFFGKLTTPPAPPHQDQAPQEPPKTK